MIYFLYLGGKDRVGKDPNLPVAAAMRYRHNKGVVLVAWPFRHGDVGNITDGENEMSLAGGGREAKPAIRP